MIHSSFAIIGTGALGGFYGAKLQKAGANVHFLLHRDFEHVQQRGLIVDSPEGDFTLPKVNAYHDVLDMPPCQVVIVALKATDNHKLEKLLPPLVDDKTIVLVLQNGLGNEQYIASIVGHDRVVGGLCFLCSNKVGPGHIVHLDFGRITFAQHTSDGLPAGSTMLVKALAGDFADAGIETHVADDLVLARWQKLVWNVPFNGLTVVLDTTTDRIMADEDTRALAEALMLDVVAGAAAFGRTIEYEFVERMLEDTRKMTPYQPSMKVDFDRRRTMEIEPIFGNPLRSAERAGVDLPRLNVLYRQLKFIARHNI